MQTMQIIFNFTNTQVYFTFFCRQKYGNSWHISRFPTVAKLSTLKNSDESRFFGPPCANGLTTIRQTTNHCSIGLDSPPNIYNKLQDYNVPVHTTQVPLYKIKDTQNILNVTSQPTQTLYLAQEDAYKVNQVLTMLSIFKN